MKLIKHSMRLLSCLAGLMAAAALNASAQTTAFTYQGHLTDGGSPATGTYDLQFGLLDAATNGNPVANPMALAAVGVTNGLFTVPLDFGAAAFSGANRWLEIGVRTNGSSSAYTVLTPRQAVNSTPYAIQALSAQFAQSAPFSGLSGLPVTLGNNTIGSVGNNPLEIYVNGMRTFRFEPSATGAPNIVGGASVNYVAPFVVGATIGGGGAINYNGSPYTNSIGADLSTIAGGLGNTIQNDAFYSTIGGGSVNTIQTNADSSMIGGGYLNAIQTGAALSTIGGGYQNTIQTYANNSAISGGYLNTIQTGAYDSTICGGYQNLIQNFASRSAIGGGYANEIQFSAFYSAIGGGKQNTVQYRGSFSAIGGGYQNSIQPNAQYCTIPGGAYNLAGGKYSFAAGYNSQANDDGTFVWADSTGSPFTSTAPNQFLVRAKGGVGINKNNPATALDVNGTITATAFNGPIVGSATSATNFIGGLGGDVTGTQGATVVSSVGGQTAANVASAVSLANAASSALAASAIVRRDASGSFVARTITANNFSGSGAALLNLNASQLTSGAVPARALSNAWQLGGNSGTTPGAQFIGTSDNQALEFKVNGGRALRLEPNTDTGAPNVIGGSPVNFVGAGVVGATIGGGGTTSYFGLGVVQSNFVAADYSTICGGLGNAIQTNSIDSTIDGGLLNSIQAGSLSCAIGGGFSNTIGSSSHDSAICGGFVNRIQDGAGSAVIGGGDFNTIQTYANNSTIGGGAHNTIGTNAYISVIGGGGGNAIQDLAIGSTIGGGSGNAVLSEAGVATISGGYKNTIQIGAFSSTIGGGSGNVIQTNAFWSMIGSGRDNVVQSNGQYAVIAGGWGNVVTNFAFAAGYNANATDTGAFVWSDSTGTLTGSAGPNSVTMRASGGFVFLTDTNTGGATLPAGGTSWATISDRNAKKNFKPVDGAGVLEKLAAIPVQHWNYKWEADNAVPHLGPVAQDFKAAFYPGRDDKSITTLEFDGVELAAIQGLNQKVETQKAELAAKQQQIESLEKRLANLEELVQAIVKRPRIGRGFQAGDPNRE